MKKIFLTIAMTASVVAASAALPKGSIFLGLNVGFGSTKYDYSSTNGNATLNGDKTNYSNWNFGPSGQYFFMDNMSAGLNLNFGHSRYENLHRNNQNDKYISNSRNMNVGLFGRKYWNCADNFYTYAELAFGIGSSSGEEENIDGQTSVSIKTTSDGKSKNAGINLGFAWMATPRVMFQGNFGFLGFSSWNNRYNVNAAGDQYNRNKGSDFNFYLSSGSLPFSLGFAYRINGGSE